MIKRKLISLLLAASILIAAAPAASAYTQEQKDAADELYTLGLFYGTDKGFELDRSLTRQEAAAMVVRLVGKETTALNGTYRTDFTDVALWAEGYVGYAQTAGLVAGYDNARLGATDTVTGAQYLTFVLRALGYSDSAGDFIWSSPWALAKELGLTTGQAEFDRADFTRGDVVLISRRALDVAMKGTDMTLREYLALSEQAQSTTALTASQIYRKCSGAVFYLESYEDEACENPVSSASGFFIAPDGIAVTNYHAVIDTAAARITTKDGETYRVTRILYGSTRDDVVIMQVSRTAESGHVTESFPCLELADQSSLHVGDTVYSLGAPLGLTDTFASGIVSNLSRVLGSRTYIQMTVPTSSGSSGGPVVNAYGKVVGISSASFTQGQNLNLAEPVNVIKTARYDRTGTEYASYFAGKEYHITANPAAVTVKEGETVTVSVGNDYPFSSTLLFENNSIFTVSAAWGDWTDDQHVELFLTGITEGYAEIVISFTDIRSDASVTIPIIVLPGDPDNTTETGETP